MSDLTEKKIEHAGRDSSRLICGVGINDAKYKVTQTKMINGVRKRVWICPYYGYWLRMINRCYSPSGLKNKPTYSNCSVCEDWLTFSNFRVWMEKQDFQGKQLDKDILFPENKVYSPETCIFVYNRVSSFILDAKDSRGEFPIGVSWAGHACKFRAECSNPLTKRVEKLGYFNCPQEAHTAWLTRKLELAKLLAAEQDDPRVAKALVDRYENYNVGCTN